MKKQFTNPTPIGKMKKNLTQKERKEFIDKYLGPIEPEKEKTPIDTNEFMKLADELNNMGKIEKLVLRYEKHGPHLIEKPGLREIVAVVNQIIERLEQLDAHYSKDVRGGKFGGKIV